MRIFRPDGGGRGRTPIIWQSIWGKFAFHAQPAGALTLAARSGLMARMTKRKIGIKRGKSSKGGPGYRKGRTVLSVLSFAVVTGFTLAVAYDSRAYDEVRRTSFSELALRLPDGLKDVHFNPPQVSAPIRLGEWPSWFIGHNEETRSK